MPLEAARDPQPAAAEKGGHALRPVRRGGAVHVTLADVAEEAVHPLEHAQLLLGGDGGLHSGEAGGLLVDEGAEVAAREAGGQRGHQLDKHLVRRAQRAHRVVRRQEATTARAPHRLARPRQPVGSAGLEEAQRRARLGRAPLCGGGQQRGGWRAEQRRLRRRRRLRCVDLAYEQAAQVLARGVGVPDRAEGLGDVLAAAVEEPVVAAGMVEVGHVVHKAVNADPARVRRGVTLHLLAVDLA
mmetsp:Transcript_62339/g.150263  ORF Transcript_62339/g.150263 Transcript_62339/m.150263 type:complete len:242 (+) Transcript_62339:1348-2073(+)